MRRGCIVVGIALWIVPSAAGAARPTAACLDVQAEGLPAALVGNLTLALRVALAADGGFARVEPKASLMELRLLLDCQATTPACWAAVARTVQVQTLFVAEVEAQGDGYRMRLQRIDGITGKVTATFQATLTGGPEALVRALHDQAADFFATLRGGVVRVVSEPSASEVLVDGAPRGTTPLVLRLRPGRHRIEVRQGRSQPFAEEVEVVAGGSVEVSARLAELPVAVPATQPRVAGAWGRLRPVTVGTMVAAGVVLATGVVLGAVQRQTQTEYNGLTLTRREDVDRRFQLETRGKNLSIGADVAFGVGGAALVVAGVLAYRDLRAGRETRPVRLTIAPAAVAVTWTY